MTEGEHRHIARDSLFVMAELRLDNSEEIHKIRVRNLSDGGLMGDAPLHVLRGQIVWINLRNLGWVAGSVAWVQDNRFGVAFQDEVDHRLVRAPLKPDDSAAQIVRPPLGAIDVQGQLRKI